MEGSLPPWKVFEAGQRALNEITPEAVITNLGVSHEEAAELQGYIKRLLDEEKAGRKPCPHCSIEQVLLDRYRVDWKGLEIWDRAPLLFIQAALKRCIEAVAQGESLVAFARHSSTIRVKHDSFGLARVRDSPTSQQAPLQPRIRHARVEEGDDEEVSQHSRGKEHSPEKDRPQRLVTREANDPSATIATSVPVRQPNFASDQVDPLLSSTGHKISRVPPNTPTGTQPRSNTARRPHSAPELFRPRGTWATRESQPSQRKTTRAGKGTNENAISLDNLPTEPECYPSPVTDPLPTGSFGERFIRHERARAGLSFPGTYNHRATRSLGNPPRTFTFTQSEPVRGVSNHTDDNSSSGATTGSVSPGPEPDGEPYFVGVRVRPRSHTSAVVETIQPPYQAGTGTARASGSPRSQRGTSPTVPSRYPPSASRSTPVPGTAPVPGPPQRTSAEAIRVSHAPPPTRPKAPSTLATHKPPITGPDQPSPFLPSRAPQPPLPPPAQPAAYSVVPPNHGHRTIHPQHQSDNTRHSPSTGTHTSSTSDTVTTYYAAVSHISSRSSRNSNKPTSGSNGAPRSRFAEALDSANNNIRQSNAMAYAHDNDGEKCAVAAREQPRMQPQPRTRVAPGTRLPPPGTRQRGRHAAGTPPESAGRERRGSLSCLRKMVCG
ncbi:hypothetical protein B0T26DRAFT_751990 [Lasiosphaeria miniovina]|uniref:Uncharacterized protein n=1 Tax=Lasiosphaeria miniovina TaxID=1954250 RepID=A0AA40ALJ0_9PEZI|nr:uncharacterized protein B0T26DRAFT_751990 [Lasiosphaeria miniovina]KAK0718005.1 hypothetical protein B0T26DRAFT_751990 [Lasiosphaeria miniovina]